MNMKNLIKCQKGAAFKATSTIEEDEDEGGSAGELNEENFGLLLTKFENFLKNK